MSTIEPTTFAPIPISHPRLRQRVVRMATVWVGLGAVMGFSLGMTSGGLIGAVATMVAGMVEMVILGTLFALIGGRPGESLLGSGCGLVIGTGAGLMGRHANAVFLANFGLVAGALAGGTLRPYLKLVSLPAVLLWRRRNSLLRLVSPGETGAGQ